MRLRGCFGQAARLAEEREKAEVCGIQIKTHGSSAGCPAFALLFRPDAGILNELAPTRHLGGDEGAEFFRSRTNGFHVVIGE